MLRQPQAQRFHPHPAERGRLPGHPPFAARNVSTRQLVSQSAFSTRRTRRRTLPLLGAVLFAVLLAAGCDDEPSGSNRKVTRVAVTGATATVEAGKTLQLTAVAYDRRDRVVTGSGFAWSSSSDAVATVSQDGVVTGRTAGPVVITAVSQGVSGTITLTVTAVPVVPAAPATRVVVVPSFSTVDAGGTATLRGVALAANGDTVRTATFTWSAAPEAAATVNTSGVVTGVAAGQARVVVRSGTLADTATVAVLGARSLLSTAFPAGSVRSDVRAGETFTVPVVLDLGKLGNNGDLGSAQFDLVFDPAVIQYESVASALQGAAETNLVSPGRVRFAFAGTSPQGTARITLAALTFRVASNAPVGTQTTLDLVFTAAPTSTEFEPYEIPVVVDGSIRVAAP